MVRLVRYPPGLTVAARPCTHNCSRLSAASPWQVGFEPAASTTWHNFLGGEPDLNLPCPAVCGAADPRPLARFLAFRRGFAGFPASTGGFSFLHDAALTDQPGPAGSGGVKPYSMQEHVHDRSRPETLEFLRDLRSVLDGLWRRTDGGGGDRLPTVRCSGWRNTPAGRGRCTPPTASSSWTGSSAPGSSGGSRWRAVLAKAPDGWPAWAFSNHDKPRVVTRGAAARAVRISPS